MSRPNKLIYILNTYSKDESSHFFHIIGLIEMMASQGVTIALVIEKAKDIPIFENPNIKVIPQKHNQLFLRYCELFLIIAKLIHIGYLTSFTRISTAAGLIASIAHRIYGGQSFFWKSGTTIEYDEAQPMSMKKLRWILCSKIPTILLNRASHNIVTGPSFMIDYYSTVGKIPRHKLKLLFNDVNIERFAPKSDASCKKEEFLASHGFSADCQILLLVHRLSPVRKTLMYFPKCLSALKDKQLLKKTVTVIAGDGPDLPSAISMANILGVTSNCIFLGKIPNREIEPLYDIADIFIHPTYNEGFPRVILEAMAAGLPIVTTDAGGTAEVFGPQQSSRVVNKDEPEMFSKALLELLESPQVRTDLSVENQERVKMYSTENVAEMYRKVLFDD